MGSVERKVAAAVKVRLIATRSGDAIPSWPAPWLPSDFGTAALIEWSHRGVAAWMGVFTLVLMMVISHLLQCVPDFTQGMIALGVILAGAGLSFSFGGWGTVIAFPFFVGMLYAPFPLAWVFMFIAVFWLFFNTGPANTILANVTRSDIRARAFAINILMIHALGDAISPPIIGTIRDSASLHTAFLTVSFLIPVSGLLWVLGAKHLDADTANADQPLGSSQTTNPT